MKIVIAPDSFKGSLSAIGVIKAIRNAAENVFEKPEIVEVPIADGGEGTVDAVIKACRGKKRKSKIQNPIARYIQAEYGVVDDTAIIEMASCSGLTLLKESERNPLKTTSFGTGEMIKHVLDEGFRKIVIGIGGSATNDGGCGAAMALGAKFFDQQGAEMSYMSGEKLSNINRIDIAGLDSRLKNCDINVMCDVTNPLTGKNGATYVYGRQKGADEDALNILEKGMKSYEKILTRTFSKKIGKSAGAGAAGGMGAALMGYCGGKLVSGIDEILKLSDFKNRMIGADFVITGEGRIDAQSAFGKVIHGVAKHAKEKNIPVIAVTGSVGAGFENVYGLGVNAIVTIPDKPMSLEACMKDASSLIEKACINAFRLINI